MKNDANHPTHDPDVIDTNRQAALFAHAYEHARARAGTWLLPEVEMVHDCWGYPIYEAPGWAYEKARAGDPSVTFCPVLNPHLMQE